MNQINQINKTNQMNQTGLVALLHLPYGNTVTILSDCPRRSITMHHAGGARETLVSL